MQLLCAPTYICTQNIQWYLFNPQELGYKGEIGYQTFLYSNESEIRKVFMFLVDKLPKDTAETAEEPLGKTFWQ